MSTTGAPHVAARRFQAVADGATVLIAVMATVIAGLMFMAPISTGSGDVRIPSTAKTSESSPSASASVIARSPAATPSASPSPPPSAEPSPAPSPAPSAEQTFPIVVSTYRSGGHTYAGIEARPATIFLAPFEGKVEVRIYQFIKNEVRIGSNIPSLPFFPYVTLVSIDRRLTFRPGAIGSDAEVIARNAQRVGVGSPLFRTIDDGRSSWATFYDRSIPFQVIASLQALPGGRELDPLIGYLVD